ncbi:MAG: hypothetical protein HC849_20765 [Oscillatoriales cyanobacterium RU_3_3]|nr:hypothetical protein [Microcoleus sp. SU_5_6]NJL65949.1 hypothetical protein [Microcoleus sp. SM1_3_4]NJM62085.1 hypothetical protein [Oscillatoriales cyanobacterium RU_3_3]NJR22200.1 hypothetical protein [Richelia sp. CSU_2_1]
MKQEKLTMGAAFFGVFLRAIGWFKRNSFQWGGAGKLRKSTLEISHHRQLK